MTVDELRRALRENNIREDFCIIFPAMWIAGALCLANRQPYTEDDSWRVFSFDQGGFVIDCTFASESRACRFFLKHALSDPTNRKDFKQFPATPEDLRAWQKKELDKYDLNEPEVLSSPRGNGSDPRQMHIFVDDPRRA